MAYENHTPVSIGFTGDVMIGGMVNDKITENGFSYPWGDMLPLFKGTDLNLVNLEAPLTHYNKQQKRKSTNLKAEPNRIQTLVEARIDVVNIANNHILDFYEEGMLETIDLLNKAGIHHIGAGNNMQQAAMPVIVSKNGISIGLLGFTDNEPYWMAVDKPGTNYVQVGDITTIKNAIAGIKDKVDILILSIHWGDKMNDTPLPEFVSFAHKIIDAGVDIIHGHGAHVCQGVEIYNGKLIMYDTGDLIDDYDLNPQLKNNQTCFFNCEIDKNGVRKVKLIPIVMKDMQARIARNFEHEDILGHMQQLSAAFGTIINSNGEVLVN
ncbi:CapA family protein [Solitalea sp. MAHUQ-68]|uniref:CapA family protein n=1 Tax=Solitalea agri TaxID=2953739 RepID=A0A9X2F3T1_9SPHI|nr:CapA family protein [Solitalea agri]MCO4293660.1 CapA family protein [Solitalea agri]